jgi:hypothetical protein
VPYEQKWQRSNAELYLEVSPNSLNKSEAAPPVQSLHTGVMALPPVRLELIQVGNQAPPTRTDQKAPMNNAKAWS